MEIPHIDYSKLTDEQITHIRKSLPRKKKYQRKGAYRRKENPTRFFNPNEWEKFIYSTKEFWRFYYWFLFLTGTRYKEAKHIKINDIDFPNRSILIRKPKGVDAGKTLRHVQLSSYAKRYILSYIRVNSLKGEDTFNFPTIQGLRQYMQRKLDELNFKDFKDFSVHNLRKTHENYLFSLEIDDNKVMKHMGHNLKTAHEHYLSSAFIKDKKQLDRIRTWLGDAFS